MVGSLLLCYIYQLLEETSALDPLSDIDLDALHCIYVPRINQQLCLNVNNKANPSADAFSA